MKPTYVVGGIIVIIASIMGVLFVTNTNEPETSTPPTSDHSDMSNSNEQTVGNPPVTEAYPHLEGANIGEVVDRLNETEVTVRIDDFLYEETVLTVSKGTKVTWVNNGQVSHNITTAAGSEIAGVNSELLRSGGTFSHTFNQTGTFEYFCSPHPTQMRGVVVVL